MICSDKFVNYLKDYGYSVIRLPKADIEPLQLLVDSGKDLVRLGALREVLTPCDETTLPELKPNRPAANVSGQRTSDLSVGVGLSILGPIIGAMGGSKLGLDSNYRQARTLTFEFDAVLEDSIAVAQLDQYLASSDINPLSVHVGQLLEAEQVYVISAVLKSCRLTVEAKTVSQEGLAVSVPVVQQAIGANVKVSASSESASRVTYEGPTPLAFGFQAVQLFYENGHYTAFKPLSLEKRMRSLKQLPQDGAVRLLTGGVFTRLVG